ncbi:phage shock protein C [Dermatophilus congolensis]|uniref:Phage shock protein C n=1 Tax=Dermatophilus congolensis TaxID=1863 RepID=A0A239V9S9_9MICO|nr:PspC domain-containing protein [Dermatophilus congolensis]SNV18776.1 phage shock protein C [Dermatophilus congolensis]
MQSVRRSLYKMGLVRDTDRGWLGGVCAGLAGKFGMDVKLMRVLVFAGMVVVPGSPAVLYPIMWVCMPRQDWRPGVAGRDSMPVIGYSPQDYVPPRR